MAWITVNQKTTIKNKQTGKTYTLNPGDKYSDLTYDVVKGGSATPISQTSTSFNTKFSNLYGRQPKEGEFLNVNGVMYVYTPDGTWRQYKSSITPQKETTTEETSEGFWDKFQEILDNLKAKNEPTDQERQQALSEAQSYYGYTLPTGQSPAYYPIQLQEIEDQVNKEKQRLLEDYNKYLEDLETGKIRAGTDYQNQLEQALEERRLWLEEKGIEVRTGLEQLNRQWIGRGALFAGPRFQSTGQYQQLANISQQQYTGNWQYIQAQKKTEHQRAMEDYQKQVERFGQLYGRGVEDITTQRLKNIRSLQEKYQLAVGQRTAQTLAEKWGT